MLEGNIETGLTLLVTLPSWKCHKIVQAIQIGIIDLDQYPLFQEATCRGSFALGTACGHCERCRWELEHGVDSLGARLIPKDVRYAPIHVGKHYMTKHQPKIGGYYVKYRDNYESFSPQKEFEDGYTLIGD
jgi:hypothetical protein